MEMGLAGGMEKGEGRWRWRWKGFLTWVMLHTWGGVGWRRIWVNYGNSQKRHPKGGLLARWTGGVIDRRSSWKYARKHGTLDYFLSLFFGRGDFCVWDCVFSAGVVGWENRFLKLCRTSGCDRGSSVLSPFFPSKRCNILLVSAALQLCSFISLTEEQ